MSTLNKTNGTANVQLNENAIAELTDYSKQLRKARLRVWDIMFSNIVTSQFEVCRNELEQGALSLTNAIAIIDSTVKGQSTESKIKKGEAK